MLGPKTPVLCMHTLVLVTKYMLLEDSAMQGRQLKTGRFARAKNPEEQRRFAIWLSHAKNPEEQM